LARCILRWLLVFVEDESCDKSTVTVFQRSMAMCCVCLKVIVMVHYNTPLIESVNIDRWKERHERGEGCDRLFISLSRLYLISTHIEHWVTLNVEALLWWSENVMRSRGGGGGYLFIYFFCTFWGIFHNDELYNHSNNGYFTLTTTRHETIAYIDQIIDWFQFSFWELEFFFETD